MVGVLAIDGERYPEVVASDTALAGRDDACRFGIDRILDGLATFIARHS